MDWNAAIDRNREALKRILATLVGMAALAGGGTTLSRRLHRAVLSLLLPAESAARRLIIAAARGLALPPVGPHKPEEPIPHGIAVTCADLGRAAAIRAARPRSLSLPLLDPLRTPFRCHTLAHAPRIPVIGFDMPFRLLPPSPDDPIDAARLALRLAALASALDDLPGHARRFARWKARSDVALAQRRRADAAALAQDKQAGSLGVQGRGRHTAGVQGRKSGKAVRFHRLWSPKPGRPAGVRRKPTHEVREVLDVAHGQSFLALESPDTS